MQNYNFFETVLFLALISACVIKLKELFMPLYELWEVRRDPRSGVEWKVLLKKGTQWECQRYVDKNTPSENNLHVRYEIEEI